VSGSHEGARTGPAIRTAAESGGQCILRVARNLFANSFRPTSLLESCQLRIIPDGAVARSVLLDRYVGILGLMTRFVYTNATVQLAPGAHCNVWGTTATL